MPSTSHAIPKWTPYQVAILNGLQAKHVYQGTVPAHVKDRRRAVGKVARQSRRVNRGR